MFKDWGLVKYSMSKNDQGLTGLLQTPKRPESGSAESEPAPHRGSSGAGFLIALIAASVGGLLMFAMASGIPLLGLMHRPGEIPVVAMVAYTLLIPYMASDRVLKLVPWDRL